MDGAAGHAVARPARCVVVVLVLVLVLVLVSLLVSAPTAPGGGCGSDQPTPGRPAVTTDLIARLSPSANTTGLGAEGDTAPTVPAWADLFVVVAELTLEPLFGLLAIEGLFRLHLQGLPLQHNWDRRSLVGGAEGGSKC